MNRELLKVSLEKHEARRLKPYKDSVDKLTIGVGRNLTDNGLREREVDYLLQNDIDDVERCLDAQLSWWRSLDDVRMRVLAEMCFNLGIYGLLCFKTTLYYILHEEWPLAARQMLRSKWAKQVGKRATTLAKMMETGQDA